VETDGNTEETSDLSLVIWVMIVHHTKNKGDLGVLKVKVDLFTKGYLILNPETEHAPFDIVIYKNGVFKTVQVKYRNLTKSGIVMLPLRSCYSTSKGVRSKNINKTLIDIVAIYCPQTDTCYYFKPTQFGKSATLRVNMPLNNQLAGIHLAENFREVP